jgi:hypothetical protein
MGFKKGDKLICVVSGEIRTTNLSSTSITTIISAGVGLVNGDTYTATSNSYFLDDCLVVDLEGFKTPKLNSRFNKQ